MSTVFSFMAYRSTHTTCNISFVFCNDSCLRPDQLFGSRAPLCDYYFFFSLFFKLFFTCVLRYLFQSHWTWCLSIYKYIFQSDALSIKKSPTASSNYIYLILHFFKMSGCQDFIVKNQMFVEVRMVIKIKWWRAVMTKNGWKFYDEERMGRQLIVTDGDV